MEHFPHVPYFVVLLWCGPTVNRDKQHLCHCIKKCSESLVNLSVNVLMSLLKRKILLKTRFVVLQRFRTVKSISTATDNCLPKPDIKASSPLIPVRSPWLLSQSPRSPSIIHGLRSSSRILPKMTSPPQFVSEFHVKWLQTPYFPLK